MIALDQIRLQVIESAGGIDYGPVVEYTSRFLQLVARVQ